jgi:transcriptional regulator with XRE-family HTH domain
MKYREPGKVFALKIWRQNNKVSLRELAKITRIDFTHLYRLEAGKYEATKKTARKIFKGLKKWEVENKPQIQTSFPEF